MSSESSEESEDDGKKPGPGTRGNSQRERKKENGPRSEKYILHQDLSVNQKNRVILNCVVVRLID